MAQRRQSGASSAERSAGADDSSAAKPSAGGGGSSSTSRPSAKDHNSGTPSPDEQVRALYEQAESNAAKAFEEYVSKPSFGWLLARSAENVAALSRIGSEFTDLMWRNLRIAGRADVTRLARQLHRTEDKLERVLQEVEQLRDEISQQRKARP
jgi:hypothetical protein